MKSHELLPQDLMELIDVAWMGPEGVMHCCEGEAFLTAAEGSIHHVGGVERVNEVRRERRVLLVLVDGLEVERANDAQLLEDGVDDICVTGALVGLHAGQFERGAPLDCLALLSDQARALGEPGLNFVSVLEEVANALEGEQGEILARAEQIS